MPNRRVRNVAVWAIVPLGIVLAGFVLADFPEHSWRSVLLLIVATPIYLLARQSVGSNRASDAAGAPDPDAGTGQRAGAPGVEAHRVSSWAALTLGIVVSYVVSGRLADDPWSSIVVIVFVATVGYFAVGDPALFRECGPKVRRRLPDWGSRCRSRR